MLAGITVRCKVGAGAEIGMGAPFLGAHCGFRRYIHFRPGLTLKMKFIFNFPAFCLGRWENKLHCIDKDLAYIFLLLLLR